MRPNFTSILLLLICITSAVSSGAQTLQGDNIYARNGARIVAGTAGSPFSGSAGAWVSMHSVDVYRSNYMEYAGGNLIFQIADAKYRSPLTLQRSGSVVINALSTYDGRTIDTRGHELSVVGGILCEEIEVTGTVPQSDYVFDADYDLISLDSVETFIQDNHHLPGVPSAEEFKGGYSVGKMDDLLLRKVEELTLYVIELNEKIRQLEKLADRSDDTK